MEPFKGLGHCLCRTLIFLGLTILLIFSLFILVFGFVAQLVLLPQLLDSTQDFYLDRLKQDLETRDFSNQGSKWACLSIALGAILMIHIIGGFLSACSSRRGFLLIHSVLGLAVIACGVWISTGGALQVGNYAKTRKGLLIRHYKTYEENESNEEKDLKQIMDNIQSDYHCCGIKGFSDWMIPNGPYPQTTSPGSCCGKSGGTCNILTDRVYAQGCAAHIDYFVDVGTFAVIGFMITLTFVQLIVIIAAITLALCMQRRQESNSSPSSRTDLTAVPVTNPSTSYQTLAPTTSDQGGHVNATNYPADQKQKPASYGGGDQKQLTNYGGSGGQTSANYSSAQTPAANYGGSGGGGQVVGNYGYAHTPANYNGGGQSVANYDAKAQAQLINYYVAAAGHVPAHYCNGQMPAANYGGGQLPVNYGGGGQMPANYGCAPMPLSYAGGGAAGQQQQPAYYYCHKQ